MCTIFYITKYNLYITKNRVFFFFSFDIIQKEAKQVFIFYFKNSFFLPTGLGKQVVILFFPSDKTDKPLSGSVDHII